MKRLIGNYDDDNDYYKTIMEKQEAVNKIKQHLLRVRPIDIGLKIQQLRLYRGYSVPQLAKMAGISKSHMYYVEKNQRQTIPTIQNVLTALGENVNLDIGMTIKNLRDRQKISLGALNEAAGIHRGYVSELENGNKNGSIEFIEKLCNCLGATAWDVIIGKVK